jgi:hypothetical protein
MALTGIGAQGGSPLEKFQQARNMARKKIDGEDGKAKLAELLARKQAELGGELGGAAKPQAAPMRPPSAARSSAAAIFPGLGGDPDSGVTAPAGYGRKGSIEKQDPKPKLGRYVDFMA